MRKSYAKKRENVRETLEIFMYFVQDLYPIISQTTVLGSENPTLKKY